MKQLGDLFKALADETRLRILALLLEERELCVCDIIAALQLPQSTVSRHLAYLRRSGLVHDRRCGLWMYYSIADGKGAFHKGLVEFLKHHLRDFPAGVTDRARLVDFGKENRCA